MLYGSLPAGHFLLALDDQVAILNDVDGGDIKAQVVSVSRGPEQAAEKHLSLPAIEPFAIKVGLPMGKPLNEWVTTSVGLGRTRKTGSIVVADFDYRALRECHFRDALIEEITIPALDGNSKEPAFFAIKFQPEEVTYAKGNNAVVSAIVNVRQKRWFCSNFRIHVGALPCSRVLRIGSFTIRQQLDKSAIGADRISRLSARTVEFPNLTLTLGAADLDPWEKWYTDFVVNGLNDQSKELTGAIEFLDSSNQQVIGAIDLAEIGIYSLKFEKPGANSDAVARYVAELYVGAMAFKLKSS